MKDELTPIYEPLDEGIAEVVNFLRNWGIDTFTSCQGGEGHMFTRPTIRIKPSGANSLIEDAESIAAHLVAVGYGGFHTKICQAYQHAPTPWRPTEQTFIEVEFWDNEKPPRASAGAIWINPAVHEADNDRP